MTATPYAVESGDRYTSLEEACQTARRTIADDVPAGHHRRLIEAIID